MGEKITKIRKVGKQWQVIHDSLVSVVTPSEAAQMKVGDTWDIKQCAGERIYRISINGKLVRDCKDTEELRKLLRENH